MPHDDTGGTHEAPPPHPCTATCHQIRKRHTKGRHPPRVREGRRAAPESLGLGPDRVVGLASFLNQERRMLHDGIHRGDRLPAAMTGGVMSMKVGTRGCTLAR